MFFSYNRSSSSIYLIDPKCLWKTEANTEKSLFIGVYVYICIHIYVFLIKPFISVRSWSLCNNVIWSDFTVVIGKAVIPDQENNLRNMWTDIGAANK